jgi:2,4-dienoyl-CoA reductase-like NADH-dependent reductase (Old Yellow Enzyme family)
MRSPADLIGQAPLCPSDHVETGATALSTEAVEQLIEDFICAAERAEKAGFDGVEIHGAHGYILAQFLSGTINQRKDQYGGSIENRMRPITEIIDGIRARCRADFLLGLRLSPERFDVQLGDIIEVAKLVLAAEKIDFLDMSLWDSFKEPEEEAFKGRSLLSYFTELERGNVASGYCRKTAQSRGNKSSHGGRYRFYYARQSRHLAPRFPNANAGGQQLHPGQKPGFSRSSSH